ncbi:hypothetical protein [Cerasicoccus fimbriatus]|uniref:hypothetical protein n=1 Tax=Cerasicoccus fimbriatus TaxID=3014554 RepID=UPI0022B36BAD|nr:hypothetical protein [Cerasicoccus sp. TK19100]
MIRTSVILWLILLAQSVIAQIDDGFDWIALMRAQGIASDEQIETLAKAINAYSLGDEEALHQVWMSDDELTANLAFAAYLSELSTDDALAKINDLNPTEAQLDVGQIAGLISNSMEGAYYVVNRPGSFDPEISNLLLLILTGEHHTTPEAWSQWIAAHPEGFDWSAINDPVLLRARLQEQQNRAMRNALSDFEEQDETGITQTITASMGSLFEGLEQNRQAALEAKDSPLLDRANRHYYFGELSEAEKAYLTVIEEDPNNVFAIWMRGCVLFEMENYPEAEAMFTMAAAQEPDSDSAAFMRNLSRRRNMNPAEPLQRAAWSQLLETPTHESFGMMGNGDPFIARLQGERALYKPGIYHLSAEELLAKAAATNDPKLALGYTMMTPNEGKDERVALLAERFPKSPSVQQANLTYTGIQESDPEIILPLIEQCLAIDPNNQALILQKIATLGAEEPLIPEELRIADIDYYYYEKPPLNEAQLKAMIQFAVATEYLSNQQNLRQCIDLAAKEMNHRHIADHTGFTRHVSDFRTTGKLNDQIDLSARIAIHQKNDELLATILTFLNALLLAQEPRATQMTERMMVEMVRLRIRTIEIEREGTPDNDKTDPEFKKFLEQTRRFGDLGISQSMLYYVPIPSLNQIMQSYRRDTESYHQQYDAFLAEQ